MEAGIPYAGHDYRISGMCRRRSPPEGGPLDPSTGQQAHCTIGGEIGKGSGGPPVGFSEKYIGVCNSCDRPCPSGLTPSEIDGGGLVSGRMGSVLHG